MKKFIWLYACLTVLLAALLAGSAAAQQAEDSSLVSPSAIQPPVLIWQKGGCYSSWCETGWYSSPAVADLNGDYKMEVIGSAYTIFVLDGQTGNLVWSVPSGHDKSQPGASSVGRTWPGIVVADVDQDGSSEIVTAHSGGYVSVYDHNGYFKAGWPKRPITNELRSLAVADLDGNGNLEIAVGRAELNAQNIWVYEHTGAVRAGWPQLASGAGSAAGIYNNNIAIGDLVPGGNLEIVVPSDVITIAAYDAGGGQLSTNSMYYNHPGHDMRTWSAVPAYVDPAYELQGYGPCYTQFTPRANFADGPADIVDVNGDGINEVVAIGNVHNCNTSPYTDLYFTPYILNADRSRFKGGSYDWTTPPINTGAPLSEDYNRIESAEPNPVVVDLDGDGNQEILYASYDGKLHAFWLDKSEHGGWPFSVYHPSDGYLSFPSEPVVADLNNDGKPEVILASWTETGSHATGKLYILDNMGNQLQAESLPPAFGGWDWNGAMAAPTLADINRDGDLEIVLNTAHSGLVAYTLPGTADAQVLWGTGRGSYLRTGIPDGNLFPSKINANTSAPMSGARLTYTIILRNPGLSLSNVKVTDGLPPEVSYYGNPVYSSGSFNQSGGTVTWMGNVQTGIPVSISFQVTISSLLVGPQVITNTIQIEDGSGKILTRLAVVIANGLSIFMPLIR
jgi:uncharacterized repeat protein (TIGR01451 family)